MRIELLCEKLGLPDPRTPEQIAKEESGYDRKAQATSGFVNRDALRAKREVDVGVATFPNGEEWEEALDVDAYWQRTQVIQQFKERGGAVKTGRSYRVGAMSLAEKIDNARGRAARVGSEATLTIAEWLNINERFCGECAYCGQGWGLHIEHVVPIYLGGGSCANNMVPACRRCNAEKARMPVETFLAMSPKREAEFIARVLRANGLTAHEEKPR